MSHASRQPLSIQSPSETNLKLISNKIHQQPHPILGHFSYRILRSLATVTEIRTLLLYTINYNFLVYTHSTVTLTQSLYLCTYSFVNLMQEISDIYKVKSANPVNILPTYMKIITIYARIWLGKSFENGINEAW